MHQENFLKFEIFLILEKYLGFTRALTIFTAKETESLPPKGSSSRLRCGSPRSICIQKGQSISPLPLKVP